MASCAPGKPGRRRLRTLDERDAVKTQVTDACRRLTAPSAEDSTASWEPSEYDGVSTALQEIASSLLPEDIPCVLGGLSLQHAITFIRCCEKTVDWTDAMVHVMELFDPKDERRGSRSKMAAFIECAVRHTRAQDPEACIDYEVSLMPRIVWGGGGRRIDNTKQRQYHMPVLHVLTYFRCWNTIEFLLRQGASPHLVHMRTTTLLSCLLRPRPDVAMRGEDPIVYWQTEGSGRMRILRQLADLDVDPSVIDRNIGATPTESLVIKVMNPDEDMSDPDTMEAWLTEMADCGLLDVPRAAIILSLHDSARALHTCTREQLDVLCKVLDACTNPLFKPKRALATWKRRRLAVRLWADAWSTDVASCP